MAKSTQVITDAGTVADATFTAASHTKAHTAAGHNQDLDGMAQLLNLKATELLHHALTLKDALDAADPALPTLQSIIEVLV